jgi:predicted nucleotidyltransferase
MYILKPIIYFSVFNHPLTQEEAFLFSEITNKETAINQLQKLTDTGVIHKIDSYFLLSDDPLHVKKRITGNNEAKKIMPKAKKVASYISKFPFIKGVAISGSLSKGYYDDESDFDFFVITKSKRVWISRLFLAIYKRLFLKNSYKEFCINYFVSTSTLEIEEKNRFTATEIATVIPLFGKNEFSDFYNANDWVKKYFPNIKLQENGKLIKVIKQPFLSKSIEFIFDNPIGTTLNYLIRKHISKRWKQRYRNTKNNPYKSKGEISKHHPVNFQHIVLNKINEHYNFFEKKHGINISKEIS